MQSAAATKTSVRPRTGSVEDGSEEARSDRAGCERSSAAGASAPGSEVQPRSRVAKGRRGLRLVRPGESGTTTAEYTVVTAAAVAFGALLLKLLTGGWGQRILEVAFRAVIKMFGF